MTGVDDAWRHDELGWFTHAAGVDDEQLTELDITPYVPAEPLASSNAIGIDVSNYQGSPNWAQVAASGRSFCLLKATEGTNYISPALNSQYQGATAAGVRTGLYHFASPANAPEADADWFSAQVNRLGAVSGHLPPCLDLETGTGDLNGWAQRFVARLRANTGCVRVLIYSSASYFQSGQISENWMDANIALWVAHFGAPPGKPAYTSPRVALHQYSDRGQVAGVAGQVDLNWAIWDLNTLIPSEVPPVTAPPSSAPVTSLTVDQVNAMLGFLTALYQQGSGSVTLGSWTGWPGWVGGSGRSLTPVDYLRQGDVQNCSILTQISALSAQVAALKAQLPATGTSLSATDQQAIALAVVTMLTQRLTS